MNLLVNKIHWSISILVLFVLSIANLNTSEVFSISRGNPTQQNNLARNLQWNVFFDDNIISSSLTTTDFSLNTLTGTASGTVSSINELFPGFFQVNVTEV